MLKRIISILLIPILCLGICMPMGAMADTRNSFAEKFISNLGIVNLSVDEPDKLVTRELFALYVARMLKIDLETENDVRYFVDLENDAFSRVAVNALVERGIVSIPQDRFFRPMDNITYAEALKILLCSAGYSEYAEVRGGYPSGYYTLANTLDIDVDVKDTSNLTVSEVCNMLMGVMFVPFYDISSISVDNNGVESKKYSSQINDTIAYRYWDILKYEGTVETVYGATINSNVSVDNMNLAIIDGLLYNVSETFDITSFIGNYVDYYFIDSEARGTIIDVEIISSKKNIVIDIDDFDNIRNDTLYYYEDNKLEHINLNTPDIIYNGAYLGTKVESTLSNLNKGTITVKDQDGNGSYDVVIIENYDNFVIGNINLETENIYNKFDNTNSIIMAQIDALSIYDDNGSRTNIDALGTEQVLSVAKSKDGKFVRVITSLKEVAGTIEAFSDNSGTIKVQINGNEYLVEKTYVNEFKNTCKMGENYTFKLDHLGNIAYIGAYNSDSMLYGYIMDLDYDSFHNALKVKMLTQNQGIKIYDVSERVILDGKKTTKDKIDNVYKELCDDMYTPIEQLVRYDLNDKSVVTNIDTKELIIPYETAENSMYDIFKGNEKQQRWYAGSAMSIDRKCILKSTTPVFYIPDTKASDENYYVGTYTNKLYDGSRRICDAYSNNSLSGFADAVVVYYTINDVSTQVYDKFFVVDEIRQRIIDEEPATVVMGYKGNSYATLVIDDSIDVSALEKGDIVEFIYDINGKVVFYPGTVLGYKLVFDCSEKEPSWTVDPEIAGGRRIYIKGDTGYGDFYRARVQASYGNVMHVKDGVVKFCGTGYDEYNDAANLSSAVKIIYNENLDKLYVGTINDIIDYRSAEERCSKIILLTGSGNTISAIIYNYE